MTIDGRRDLLAAVLLLLDEWPMRESQLIREISERSGSAWIVDDASIAGALASLEYAEIAGNSVVDGHRVNHLTRRGIDYVEQHRDDLGSPWDDVENSAEEHDRRERTSAENQARRRESPEDEPPDPDATAGD